MRRMGITGRVRMLGPGPLDPDVQFAALLAGLMDVTVSAVLAGKTELTRQHGGPNSTKKPSKHIKRASTI